MSAKRKSTRKRPQAKKSRKTRSAISKPARRKKTPRKNLLKKKAAAGNRNRNLRRAGSRQGLGAGAAGQSGDLQGLSRREDADSESVEELLEEGNAFEADVVSGVEAADNAEEREVRTHEVPEDDVPEEYLDRDS